VTVVTRIGTREDFFANLEKDHAGNARRIVTGPEGMFALEQVKKLLFTENHVLEIFCFCRGSFSCRKGPGRQLIRFPPPGH
jgi:hypothetical protein